MVVGRLTREFYYYMYGGSAGDDHERECSGVADMFGEVRVMKKVNIATQQTTDNLYSYRRACK
jgi:hypothetical protein